MVSKLGTMSTNKEIFENLDASFGDLQTKFDLMEEDGANCRYLVRLFICPSRHQRCDMNLQKKGGSTAMCRPPL